MAHNDIERRKVRKQRDTVGDTPGYYYYIVVNKQKYVLSHDGWSEDTNMTVYTDEIGKFVVIKNNKYYLEEI